MGGGHDSLDWDSDPDLSQRWEFLRGEEHEPGSLNHGVAAVVADDQTPAVGGFDSMLELAKVINYRPARSFVCFGEDNLTCRSHTQAHDSISKMAVVAVGPRVVRLEPDREGEEAGVDAASLLDGIIEKRTQAVHLLLLNGGSHGGSREFGSVLHRC